jgi:hypothetical protein
VLDLLQQLHGGVGGGHPPGRAVLLDQSQPCPVDLQDPPGGLGNPLQPSQEVIGLGQHPQVPDSLGDHLTVNKHGSSSW